MDGSSLSGHERKILEEIETDLKADGELDRELSTMQLGRRRLVHSLVHRALQALVRVPVPVVAVLVTLSVGLLLVGVQFHTAKVLVVFGVVWALTLVASVGLAVRRLTARRGRRLP